MKTLFLPYDQKIIEVLDDSIKNNKLVKVNYEARLASQKIEIVGFSEIENQEIKTSIEDFL